MHISLNGFNRTMSTHASDLHQHKEFKVFGSTNSDNTQATSAGYSRSMLLPTPRASRERKLPPPLPQPPQINEPDTIHDLAIGANNDATSDSSSRQFVFGAEMATQTSIDYDDQMPLDDNNEFTLTVEKLLRNEDTPRANVFRTSNENLQRGIQKFRESNQKSYSERSRASGDKSRPNTPSVILIEQRITRSPIHMDAALIMHPFDDTTPVESHTNSLDYDHIPYVDDDVQIDTDDERIINAAIRRYQMLGITEICFLGRHYFVSQNVVDI